MRKYRLADSIRFNLPPGLAFDESSIAHQYYSRVDMQKFTNNKRMPGRQIDFDLLKTIVEEGLEKEVDPNCFVIHCRVGDVIEHVPDPTTFIDLIKKYRLHEKYHRCKVVTGNHTNRHIDKSREYVLRLQQMVRDLGIECATVSDTVDNDFRLMATCQCLIAGYRGFSWLAASINPNDVIWDIQEAPLFPWLHNKKFIKQLVSGYENQLSLKK